MSVTVVTGPGHFENPAYRRWRMLTVRCLRHRCASCLVPPGCRCDCVCHPLGMEIGGEG